MTNRRGKLVVISAPSGSGKTSVVQHLLDSTEGVAFSISYTTRLQRPSETDGVDYHFISESEFRDRIQAHRFLEWAEVHGNLYGTDRARTETTLASGLDVILDVDVQGAQQVRGASSGAVTVFVLPPSFAILEQRLRGRSQDDEEAIARRLRAARREVTRYTEYDYVLINDDLEHATSILRSILTAERRRTPYMDESLQPILESFREVSASKSGED